MHRQLGNIPERGIPQNYRVYPCISRPFMGSKEAPKIALDLYMGQRFRAKFQLNNLFKIKIIMWSLGITNAVDERLQNECESNSS